MLYREAIVKKSQEKSKRPRQGITSPQVIPNEAESREELVTENPEGRAGLDCDSEELPDINEETKVVLLPVNPHLVYVYWQISASDLKEVARVFSRLGPRARPVLRFHDTTRINSESASASNWFEVEIGLGAGNWYVHLENPATSYCLDLGLRTEGSGFHRLARSNVAEMPRACPSDKLEESYLLVAGDNSRAEAVVVPAEGLCASRSAPAYAEPKSAEGRRQEGGEAWRTAPTYAERQDREGNWPDVNDASRTALIYDEPPGGEVRSPEGKGASQRAPVNDMSFGGEEIGKGPEDARSFRAAPSEEMERKLAEFFQQREREWPRLAPGAEGREESQPSGDGRADLTEVSEGSFRAGLSSGQKSS